MNGSRYRDWKVWTRGNRMNRLYQILVLLGLIYSPTFEVFHNRRTHSDIRKKSTRYNEDLDAKRKEASCRSWKRLKSSIWTTRR